MASDEDDFLRERARTDERFEYTRKSIQALNALMKAHKNEMQQRVADLDGKVNEILTILKAHR